MPLTSAAIEMPDIDWGTNELADLNERLKAIARSGKKCVPVLHKGEVAWLVVDYDEVERCLRDSSLAYNFNSVYMNVAGYTLFNTAGEEHKAFKTAILKLLSPSMIRLKTPALIAPVADLLIDEFGAAREVELFSSFAKSFPWIIQTKLLGLPVVREDEDELKTMVSDLTQINDTAAYNWEELRKNAAAAKAKFDALYRSVVEDRRRQPTDDLLTSIVNLEIAGKKLNDDEILSVFGMVYDGAIGTSYQIPHVVYSMLRDQEILDFMIAHPDKRDIAVDELIRLNHVVGMVFRRTSEDTEIGGVVVPADSVVLLSLAAANRSEAQFEHASKFTPGRRRPSLAFGAGVRMCPGKNLARQEVIIAIDRLLDRLPGLRLIGQPIRTVGTLGRVLEEDVKIAFDDILPGNRTPLRR